MNKFRIFYFAEEADSLAVFSGFIWEVEFAGEFADFVFGEVPYREYEFFQLGLI